MSIDLEKITQLLKASLDPQQNKQAELALHQVEKQSGFAIALLQIVANESYGDTVRLASALCFKNFIKRIWVDEDGNHRLDSQEVNVIKKDIIGLMISVPTNLQTQLGEAVSVIADSDFWKKWDTLVSELVSRLTPENSQVNSGVLQVAHSIFKRWRPLFRSDELFTEILHVLTVFTEPYLQLLSQTDQLIDENQSNPNRLRELLGTLNLLVKLMYDLSCQDLPQGFEDNLSSLASFLQKYLAFNPSSISTDDESGPLEYIKSGIFQVLSLWTLRYGEDFSKFIGSFANSTWNLLTTTGLETKNDLVVSKGLQFLTSITKTPAHAQSFDDDATLAQIIENVVLPNMSLREEDLELFEDEPIEFIRRDLEGSDTDTRRRAATDFLRNLIALSEQRVTQKVIKYVTHFLSDYASNPTQKWRSKDTAVYLFSSIAAKGAVTGREGVKSVNHLVDVLEFFEQHVAADLLSQDGVHPILKMDAIRYLYVFRSQINQDQWASALPPLVEQLASSNYVIHTYAAIAVERALALRNEKGHAVISKDVVLPSAQPLIEHLFGLIESEQFSDAGITATKFQENEFLMRCIMRLLTVIRDGTEPLVDLILAHLVKITGVISLNPSNPRFCYYHFESIGALIRYGGAENQSKLEEGLYQPFAAILDNDIQDFIPYVFQLFAVLLENEPPGILPAYSQSLIAAVLKVDLWLTKGYVPALVRLLTSILNRAAKDVVTNNQLELVLGIFRQQFQSKSGDAHAFEILECILANFPSSALTQYHVPIMQMILTKLQNTASEAFILRFVRFYHFISAREGQGLGADFFIKVLDEIQQGLIVQVYMGIIMPNTPKLTRPMDRKIAVISLTKTLGDSSAFAEKYQRGWATTCNTLLQLLVNPPVTSKGDEPIYENDVEDVVFGVGFTPLVTIRKPAHDYWPEISNVKAWTGEYLRASDDRHSGRLTRFVQTRLDDSSQQVLLAVIREENYFPK